MKTYQVKSIAGYFDDFEIKAGLKHLKTDIMNKCYETDWGPIGCVIGFKLPKSDIIVRLKGTKRWKRII